MKTKQAKEESDKSTDEKPAVEPKKRGRKKAVDTTNDDKNSPAPEEPKTSKQIKKPVGKPKAIAKKPLGIRKALRTRKAAQLSKDKVKNIVKQTVTRAQKAAIKTEPGDPQEKEPEPLIPPSEIKKEPADETTPTSRSSSPRTAGRRQRLSSDMIMMKSVLADTPNNLVVGPRTSPYSMRKERSNSPSLFEGKSLRSGGSRKLKNNLLNEVVMKEQKKRRRLLSDSKSTEGLDGAEDCKKLKRGRSCSQDGSEISKCSDITESDVSLGETLNETDIKDFNKKLDKPKTDLDIDIENNVQISPIEKVPSLNVDIKLAETKSDTDPSCITKEKKKSKLSLKRSTSLDSDNNNSNRLKLGNLNSSDAEDKSPAKTENDTLFEARSSILTSMSKTFNSKEVSKNIRKARRGRKAATTPRASVSAATKTETSFDELDKLLESVFDGENNDESSLDTTTKKALGSEAATTPRPSASLAAKPSTVTSDAGEEKPETLETLTKELDDLMSKDIDNIIKNLDQNIDHDHEATDESTAENTEQVQTKPVPKLYSSKPLGDNNSIVAPDTPLKDKDATVTNENTPSKTDDSENIRLHYEDDSLDKTDGKQEKIYKSSNVANIDLLMDRLKVFEEFDKRRQRQESESRSSDSKPVMVTNDVVLIPKSGDIKPLKDIHTIRSPEKPIEKENFLSCFENNSAISIVKRDPGPRKSVDIDLPNSVTLIKRNSISARKESTSSNHSKESDAISIFEKSLGKDVTLTEIRKSVDKQPPTPTSAASVDLHQFATIQPTNASHAILIDSNQISITPRNMSESKIGSSVQLTKCPSRSSRESLSRKSSESGNDNDEKMATIEKIKSPVQQVKSPAVSITPAPVAVKSPEAQRMETEALAPPLENLKEIPEDITLTSEVPKVLDASVNPVVSKEETPQEETPNTDIEAQITKVDETKALIENIETKEPEIESKTDIPEKMDVEPELETEPEANAKPEKEVGLPESKSPAKAKLEVEAISETKSEAKSETKPEAKSETKSEAKSETKSEANLKPETEAKLPETKPEAKTEVKPEIAKATRGSKSARNSVESQPGPSNALHETPESQKRKENVLRTLGLLTHKAAKEAKIEKLKEKERIYSGLMNNKNKVAKSGDYTGTLKTVIKLNRGVGDREKKKYRSSLKMTFQKSKHRGRPPLEDGAEGQDDAFYTIERREGGAGATSDGGLRKSHYSNRLNNHDTETVPEPVEPKETLNLVIPEKASSFSIHPGRLCQDQCFYCGGKFGLFDTPCHIAQMKSADRQKKVLDNEEKLTIDSCLCDACYRHVDRRANCPSYRRRPPGPFKQATAPQPLNSQLHKAPPPQSTDKPPSPPIGEESEPDSPPALVPPPARSAVCHTEGCTVAADCSIRRKWLIKMRASVNKILKLEGDYPGLHTIPLCSDHHKLLSPLMSCALCTRRHKHHNLHQLATYEEVNPLLVAARIPVVFSERPILCKMCRYYCALLQGHKHNDKFSHSFRRKLLQIHNVQLPPESENDQEVETNQTEDPSSKQKKKVRNKSKQRKSDDQKPESESSDKTESSPEKDRKEEAQILHPLEEDIESLISSNKIPVPGAKSQENPQQSDSSENDNVYEFEPTLPLDKQTELQYLLQKQNNPAQFLQKTNLTQKQKSLNKLQNASGIQKPGHQHRVHDLNAKRIQNLGQIIAHKEKPSSDSEMTDVEKSKEGVSLFQNIPLNDECTIESIPNKRPADINTLKNKWQMSESFSQVKKNLSELSKKFTVEKDPKKTNECKYSNPVKRLETNPSISVRELFPGEEEMNLQCNIEFNSVKGVTPEGWEKCNSLIQYDVETKKLWTELQRPYGNQSSFLRHLILLEKYFRSGDLVLSHNASPHAANYSDSVQSRLRAYDNVVNDTPRRSEPAINLIEYRKPKHSVNGKSLLKNSHSEDKDSKKFMPPPGALPKKKSDKSKSKPLPPELIAINTSNNQGRAIQNVLHNIQQLVKGVSASDPTEVASAPVPPPPVIPMAPPQPVKRPESEGPKEKKEDKPKEKSKKPTSKPWRPTLMPITPENVLKTASEPTQVAVDGRHLPSLVQVMSSGKRYHITIQDYNKMCIMRREKLQQLKEGEKTKKQEDTSTVVTEIQPSTMLGNGGSVTQNIPNVKEDKPKEMPELSQISTNAATILKNVGLKNITIAPIPLKTATITSQTVSSPISSSPSLLVTSTPIKLPQLGPAVSITSETVLTPNLQNLPIMTSTMVMPKIPKSLTVIPQTVVTSIPQNVLPQNMMVPQTMMVPTTLMLQHPAATTAQVAENRP